MNILLYTPVFHPMVGGVESVAATLASLFTKLGHHCSVLTPIEHDQPDRFDYRVHRNPGFSQKLRLVREADIVMSKTASMAMLPYTVLLGKPFVWVHSGYQASCIDGLGWVDGEPAPMSPAASIRFHLKHSGLASTVKAAAKLYARRFACRHVVSMNVTVSDWVKMRQPFKRQMRIHNPFPLERFRNGEIAREPEYDFVYLGRLVSEKGVATLIRGFDLLSKRTRKLHRMLVIGDGNWRNRLESLTRELRIEDRIEFAGRKTGEELSRLVHQCRAAVVPSDWEEPMGGVAVELLAAGLPVIVSKNGGLAECVGDAGLVFENGDHQSLAEKMQRILEDRELLARLAANRESQLKLFDPPMLARQYLDLFESLLGIEPDRAIAVSEADRAFPSH